MLDGKLSLHSLASTKEKKWRLAVLFVVLCLSVSLSLFLCRFSLPVSSSLCSSHYLVGIWRRRQQKNIELFAEDKTSPDDVDDAEEEDPELTYRPKPISGSKKTIKDTRPFTSEAMWQTRRKWSILLRTESTSIKRGFSRRRRVFSLADRLTNRLVVRFQSLKMLMMFFYYPTNIDSMMTGEYLARQHKPVKHAVDTDEICRLLSLFFVSSSVIARRHCWSSWTRPYVRQFCYFVITVSTNLLQTEAITTWCYWQHRTLQATLDFSVALNWLDRPFARSQLA